MGALIPETPALAEERGRFIDDLASTIVKACREDCSHLVHLFTPSVHAFFTPSAHTVAKACREDWKGKKGPAALQLAIDKYSTKTQVVNMVKAWESL